MAACEDPRYVMLVSGNRRSLLGKAGVPCILRINEIFRTYANNMLNVDDFIRLGGQAI